MTVLPKPEASGVKFPIQKLLILNNLECRLELELRLLRLNRDDSHLSNYAEILSYNNVLASRLRS